MAFKKSQMKPAQRFLDLLAQARRKGLKYLVIGGYAVILYDVERATFDVDIGIASSVDEVTKVLELLKELGYKTIVNPQDEHMICDIDDISPERTIKMGSFGVRDGYPVDVLLIRKEDFEFLWKYKVDVPFEGQQIPIPSLLDLIRIKEKSARPKDKEDVKHLRHLLRKGKGRK